MATLSQRKVRRSRYTKPIERLRGSETVAQGKERNLRHRTSLRLLPASEAKTNKMYNVKEDSDTPSLSHYLGIQQSVLI